MSRTPRNFKTEDRISRLRKILDVLQQYDCSPAFDSEEEEMELRKEVLFLIAFSPWEQNEINRYNVVIGRGSILIQEKNKRLREHLNCNMEKKKGCTIS